MHRTTGLLQNKKKKRRKKRKEGRNPIIPLQREENINITCIKIFEGCNILSLVIYIRRALHQ